MTKPTSAATATGPDSEPPAAPAPVDLAQTAYTAYGDAVGGLNYMGLPMPPWDDLPQKIADGWVAAATAVVEALAPPAAEQDLKERT